MTTPIPVEAYLSHTYEPDHEYVDGVLVERNVGEHDHSSLLALLCAFFVGKARQYGSRVFTEQPLRVAPGRYRIPDVCVMKRPYARQSVLTEPPLLIIEFLSPDDRVSDAFSRVADYRAFGVTSIWIVDPYGRKLFDVSGTEHLEMTDRIATLRVPGYDAPIIVDFNTLFRELDD